MRNTMKEYRRWARRRRETLARMETLSEEELASLGTYIAVVQEHVSPAVTAAARELSGAVPLSRIERGGDILDMLVELSPNGSQEKSWLFMDLALAVWKRLQEQEEATQEILQNKELMRQIRESEEDFKAGRKENFVPWRA